MYTYKLVTSVKDDFHSSPKVKNFFQSVSGLEYLYYSPEWLLELSPLYLSEQETLFFIYIESVNHAEACDSIIALVPLVLNMKKLPAFNIKKLHFWGEGNFYSLNPCRKIIVIDDYDNDSLFSFISNILNKELSHSWDFWGFDKICSSRSLVSGLISAGLKVQLSDAGENDYVTDKEYVCANQQKEMGWISGNARSLVRKGGRQLEALNPPAQYEQKSDCDEAFFEKIANLHISRQNTLLAKGYDRRSFFEDKSECKVIKNILFKASRENNLRAHCIMSGDELLAVLILIAQDGHAHAYITAISQKLYNNNCNQFLWYQAINSEINKPSAKNIVYGYGGNMIKRTFSTKLFPLSNGVVVNNNFLSNIRYTLFCALRKGKQLLRR